MDIVEELKDAIDSGDAETVQRCLDEHDFSEAVVAKLLTRCLTGHNFKKDIMKSLLNTGVSPDIPGEKREMSVTVCRRIHHTPVSYRQKSSRYPLVLAVQLANIEAVKLLLEYGAYVDIVDGVNAWTALYIATMLYNFQLIEILLVSGAQPNKKVIDLTPFTFLLNEMNNDIPSEEREKILCLMLNHGANANALLSSCGFSTVKHVPALLLCIKSDVKYETVKEMVKRVADVDARDNNSNSALRKAVCCGRADLVKLLLEYGSNPNLEMTTFDGPFQTCLMMAVHLQNIDVTKLLVEAGADIEAKNTSGITVFNIALGASNTEAIALLVLHNVKFHGFDIMLSRYFPAQEEYPDIMTFSCFEIKNEDISRLLYLAGANLENVRKKRAFMNSESPNYNHNINVFLGDILAIPVPLKQLCRTTVRQKLTNEIQREINLLPIPRTLKDYILIPETKQLLRE